MTKKERIEEARTVFGDDTVDMVIDMVHIADPDGAWAEFMDQNMEEEAECVEFIYFDEED